MQATPIENAVIVAQAYKLDGVSYLEISLISDSGQGDVTYQDYKALPNALEFEGVTYGKSGWNSDSFKAYYNTRVSSNLAYK